MSATEQLRQVLAAGGLSDAEADVWLHSHTSLLSGDVPADVVLTDAGRALTAARRFVLAATTTIKPPPTLSETRIALATELHAAEVALLQSSAEERPTAKARRDAAVAVSHAYYRAAAVDDTDDGRPAAQEEP